MFYLKHIQDIPLNNLFNFPYKVTEEYIYNVNHDLYYLLPKYFIQNHLTELKIKIAIKKVARKYGIKNNDSYIIDIIKTDWYGTKTIKKN